MVVSAAMASTAPAPTTPTGKASLGGPLPWAQQAGALPLPDESLEEFLRRMREKRDAVHRELEPEVARLILALESAAPGSDEFNALESSLFGLGTEAVPLLVPWIDPGSAPTTGSLHRADAVAEFLAQAELTAALPKLEQLTEQASQRGRVKAIQLLGNSRLPTAAGSILRDLLAQPETTKSLRKHIFEGLIRLGGQSNWDPAMETLSLRRAGDAAYIDVILQAFSKVEPAAIHAPVRRLLANQDEATAHLHAIFDYFEAAPQLFDGETARLTIDLLSSPKLPPATSAALLGRLPKLHRDRGTPEWRDWLEPLTYGSSQVRRDGALICMSRLGDRGARKRLLQPFDDRVKETGKSSSSLAQRGAIYVELEEYDSALRDFKRAIENTRSTLVQQANWIQVAWVYCLQGKLSRASSALEDANLSSVMQRQLAADERFAELLQHERYGRVLRDY